MSPSWWQFFRDFGGILVAVVGWPIGSWLTNRVRTRLKTDLEIVKLLNDVRSPLAPEILAIAETQLRDEYLLPPLHRRVRWSLAFGLSGFAWSAGAAFGAIRRGHYWFAAFAMPLSLVMLLLAWDTERSVVSLRRFLTELERDVSVLEGERSATENERQALEERTKTEQGEGDPQVVGAFSDELEAVKARRDVLDVKANEVRARAERLLVRPYLPKKLRRTLEDAVRRLALR